MNSTFKKFERILALVLLVLVVSCVHGQANERDQVIRLLGESYRPVADAKNILFDVDRFRVIRAEFDKRKRLIELAVEPKYYFEEEHPEWAEPDEFANLSRVEFLELSTKLKRVKDLGKMVQSVNTIAVVTNSTAWYTEYYQNASFTWGAVGDDVRWFRFKYGDNAEKPRKERKSPDFKFPSSSANPAVPKTQPKH